MICELLGYCHCHSPDALHYRFTTAFQTLLKKAEKPLPDGRGSESTLSVTAAYGAATAEFISTVFQAVMPPPLEQRFAPAP
jgi:hypothetical protein